MSVSATFDMREMDKALPRLIQNTSRTLPAVLNQSSLNIDGRAMNETPMANRDKIQSELGMVARELTRNKKTGKFLKRGRALYASFNGTPRAALIINARRSKAGLPLLFGRDMDRAIKVMVAARKRSAGFNKSAYIPVVRQFASKLQKPFIIANMKGIYVKGREKGTAHPAAPVSLQPTAISYMKTKGLSVIGAAPLQRAVNKEAAEVIRHLDSKMAPSIKEFNQSK